MSLAWMNEFLSTNKEYTLQQNLLKPRCLQSILLQTSLTPYTATTRSNYTTLQKDNHFKRKKQQPPCKTRSNTSNNHNTNIILFQLEQVQRTKHRELQLELQLSLIPSILFLPPPSARTRCVGGLRGDVRVTAT
jgi:hypothetical protein